MNANANIGTAEAARILEIPDRTLRHQAAAGKVPYVFKGEGNQTYVFDREVIQNLADQRNKVRRSPQPPKAVA